MPGKALDHVGFFMPRVTSPAITPGGSADGRIPGTMKLTTLDALYVEQLNDLYSAANQVLRALPKMAKMASARQLRTAFSDQIHQAQVHVDRLNKIFGRLGVGPKGNACHAMEGLDNEAKDLFGDEAQPTVIDTALIAASQRLGHYLIAGIGSALTLARQLGHKNVAAVLQEMLEVGVDADRRLTDLAESVFEADALIPSGYATERFEPSSLEKQRAAT
jgi:ferritin-like metal-binding protein YciE